MATALDTEVHVGEVAIPLRRSRCVVAVQKDAGKRVVRRTDLDDISLPREVYGLCWDPQRKGIWASDKRSSKLCFFQGTSMEQVRQVLSHPEAFEPCALDWSNEHGLLAAYFGSCIGHPVPGAVFSWDLQGSPKRRTPQSFLARIAKCVWLKDSFAFVSYYESVLYLCDLNGNMTTLTAPSRRVLPATEGALPELHFRNIQSLHYSKADDTLFVGDSNYGAVYALDLKARKYHLYAGRPRLSYLGERPVLVGGNGLDSSQWLGAVCAIFEWHGRICWFNGDTGFILPLHRNGIMKAIASVGALPDASHLPTTVALPE